MRIIGKWSLVLWRHWAPRLISATVVYILSTYKLIFIAALESFKMNTKMWVGDFKYGTFDDNIFTPPQLSSHIPKLCITLKQKLVCFLKYVVPVLIDPLVVQSGQKTWAQEIQWQGQIIFFKKCRVLGFPIFGIQTILGPPTYFCNR